LDTLKTRQPQSHGVTIVALLDADGVVEQLVLFPSAALGPGSKRLYPKSKLLQTGVQLADISHFANALQQLRSSSEARVFL
jgi:hypothetical protein